MQVKNKNSLHKKYFLAHFLRKKTSTENTWKFSLMSVVLSFFIYLARFTPENM